MAIKKTSRIQYSICTSMPYIYPTLEFVKKNADRELNKSEVREYIAKEHSQGKSPNSEKDIVSKVIDRYCIELNNKKVILGDLGKAILKTWDNYPQTRNELLFIGYNKHFIVEYTILEVSNYLIKGIREITADHMKKKVKELEIYSKLAKNIENNVTEILKDLIRLNILPKKKNSQIYNLKYYAPTDLGLIYYMLYYLEDLKSLNVNSLIKTKVLKLLLTDIVHIDSAIKGLTEKQFLNYESFADIQKYKIKINSMSQLNENI